MIRVGDEVEIECPACRTLRGHTVAAIEDGRAAVLVCNYCRRRSAPRRAKAAAPARSRPRGPAAPAAAPPRAPDPATATPYRPDAPFAAGDTVRHPSFGLGVVEAREHDGKIHVRFAAGRKLLVAGR